MSPENIASGLRNMVDDIENLGAGPSTVDTALLRQAIAALTPPEGYVLVPVEMTKEIGEALDESIKHGYSAESAWDLAIHAVRPEVKP